MSEYDCVGVTSEYLESLKNKIEELEQQKAELMEFLLESYKRFKQYEMDVDMDRPYHHISFMDKFKNILKKHGVEI